MELHLKIKRKWVISQDYVSYQIWQGIREKNVIKFDKG